MGNSLLLELKEQKKRGRQELQKTTKGALSVKLYYRANTLRRQVVAKVGGDNRAWMTSGKNDSAHVTTGSKMTRKLGSDELYEKDSIGQEVIRLSVQNGVDFRLIIELGRVLLFEFLNTILLVCLIAVQVVGIVVLGVERGLENWAVYKKYKRTT